MSPRPHKSLRVRVGRIITAFSFALLLFYTFMSLQLKDSGLRDATHSVLLHEADLFLEAYARDPNTPLPKGYSLRGFIGIETLPEEITHVFNPQYRDRWHRRSSGIYYSFTDDHDEYIHHHLYTAALPQHQDELFLYYRVGFDHADNIDIWGNVKNVAYAGFALVLVMLLVLRQVIHRALEPLHSLSVWITKLRVGAQPQALPADVRDDEIGQLANNLFDALERIYAYNERERAFLRNASHELRTPIAIIRNTLDVLEHKLNRNPVAELTPPLQRIRRASDTMKAVTEAILWLAVQDYAAPSRQQVDVRAMIQELVEQNKALLQQNDIRLVAELEALQHLRVEKILLHIALDNLIRNAFQHCSGGELRIRAIDDHRIEIVNSRLHMLDSQQAQVATGGFGLGLALVQTIASKLGWEFSFDLDNEIAIARLNFGSPETQDKKKATEVA